MPRPNELSDMGRINDLTPLVGPDGKPAAGWPTRPTPVATGVARPRLWWAVVAGVLWFVATTVAELLAGGSTVDGSLFLAAVTITCLAGAIFGHSIGDDIALALGSVAGLVLSGLIVAIEPGGHAIGDIVTVAVYLGIAVLVLTPLFRRLVDWMRTA